MGVWHGRESCTYDDDCFSSSEHNNSHDTGKSVETKLTFPREKKQLDFQHHTRSSGV